MKNVLIDGEKVSVSKTKTVLSLSAPSPSWVTWVFRAEFVLNKVILFVLSASSLFTPQQVKESLLWIAAVDMAVWGMGRFVGLKKEDFDK